jgi:hypothetical protein
MADEPKDFKNGDTVRHILVDLIMVITNDTFVDENLVECRYYNIHDGLFYTKVFHKFELLR